MKQPTTVSEMEAIQNWQEARIHEALASVDRGEGISHKAVETWIKSWGTEDELPWPASDNNGTNDLKKSHKFSTPNG